MNDTDEERFEPVSPGEMLLEEFLIPMGISQNALARSMRVPVDRVNAIVRGRRSITGDTALRLSAALGTSAEFWLNLQAKYDLERARRQVGGQIAREVLPLKQ